MDHPVTWFQISGKNGKKLQSFYAKIFAWPMTPAPGNDGLMWIEPSGSRGIAGGVGTSRDGTSNVTVYVSVDDIETQLQKVEAAGGKTALEPMELAQGMGTIAGFTDPAGNFVGLWQQGGSMARPKKKKDKASAQHEKPKAKRAAKPAASKPTQRKQTKRPVARPKSEGTATRSARKRSKRR